jgi:formate-dependent nitrite reductase membrane component NrfD
MPSTFFTDSPHWGWYIVLYFFLGGIAGGSFFIAALLDMIGRPADRPIVRLGYYVAFPAIILGTILLIVDLGRPERFWHMIFQSKTLAPMFKGWSPISFGTWAISAFGLITFIAFVRALVEDGFLRQLTLVRALSRVPWAVLNTIGALLGFFVASYTGLVLAVTNRPVWADTPFLGALFVLSAASTSAALLVLLGRRNRAVGEAPVRRLERMEAWTSVFELVTLAAVIISIGSVARIWLNGWGVLLAITVLLIVVPLVLHWRPGSLGARGGTVAAALGVLAGLMIRVVIVLSSEAVPHGGYGL